MLYILRPFDLNLYRGNTFLLCLAFGGVTWAVTLIYQLSLTQLFGIRKDHPSWTFGKWILSTLVLILLIALANYGLSYVLSDGTQRFSWATLGNMVYVTLAISVFPVLLFGTLSYYRNLQRNVNIARNYQAATTPPSSPATELHLRNATGQPEWRTTTDTLRYAEAMQNYVVLHYVRDGQPGRYTLRNTLSDVAQQLAPFGVLRCHRSYLVLPEHIIGVTGNAQGLKLTLRDLPGTDQLPVSRKHVPTVRRYLSEQR